MNSWRVILQFESGSHSARSTCAQYPLSGVVVPAHISVVACDSVAEPDAHTVHQDLTNRLLGLQASPQPCGGPRGLQCMAWSEASCQHVLVLVVGSTPLDSAYEQLAGDWYRQSSGRGVIIVALLPQLTHGQVFGGGHFPLLSRCTAAAWKGVASHLSTVTLRAALLDERPGVFLSYVRAEASAAAEAVFDALTHAGYRVFLDRFNGTQGRVFPHELAEEMASMGLVALFETQRLHQSKWTIWEAAFAARYNLGPIAISFQGAPPVHGVRQRLSIPHDPTTSLPPSAVEKVVQFISTGYHVEALERRTYFETLVRAAAQAEGGDASDGAGGVLHLKKKRGDHAGSVLPAAVPGRLRHVSRLVQSQATGPYLLAGEHHHLARQDRDDLRWLAAQMGVTLAGSASVYRAVRRLF